MKSKQLANVLIKVMGLYLCISTIPGIIGGSISIFGRYAGGTWTERFINLGAYSLGNVIQGLIGLFLFIKSRNLSDSWFKGEED